MSIGDTLAEARRQSGLTVTQVSERTRIRETIIRGIEQNDFSACGGDFYARGHIRSIASVVGLDPAPLIQEYDEEHGPPAAIRAADVFEPAAPLRIKERRSLNWSVAMILALLVVVGYGVYHFVAAGSGGSGAKAVAVAPQATTTHSAAPKPTRSAASPAPTPSVPSDVVIQLTAVQDCWVFLTNDKGDTIYSGVVPAGSTQSWKETQAVNLRLGNPEGVVLEINGKKESTGTDQPVTLSLGPAQKVQISPSPAGSAGLASGAAG
ncbi:MAG TPA: RodZ domain-containing protein [Streptosporangiaceae bacterium]|nr:RodZ domain-containing protein [Streptosporangiaceae bacterium]